MPKKGTVFQSYINNYKSIIKFNSNEKADGIHLICWTLSILICQVQIQINHYQDVSSVNPEFHWM